MCCFSAPVQFVSRTNIFARAMNGTQYLVYSMEYGANTELAMILPLPVPPSANERAVRFINLERYPDFFDDMNEGFTEGTFGRAMLSLGAVEETTVRTLTVHDVGSFEASFVPGIDDFDRLDDRFRISRELWGRIPEYEDYGFAVFKLKPARDTRLHPIAFQFPRRDAKRLFFPTVHVHDGELHPAADFDHALYCQIDAGTTQFMGEWSESDDVAGQFMNVERAEPLIDAESICFRTRLSGSLPNVDCWLGANSIVPASSWGIWATCTQCGFRRRARDNPAAVNLCPRCSGEVLVQRYGPESWLRRQAAVE